LFAQAPVLSEVGDLILSILQRMQAQMKSEERKLDVVTDDVQRIKVRMTTLEEAMAGFNRRMDNIEVRMGRIERRLDLTDA
jgi:predicted  nucleic acid-binding Zn-ribbon protein